MIEARRAAFEPIWRDGLAEFSEEELRTTAAVLDRMAGIFDDIRRA